MSCMWLNKIMEHTCKDTEEYRDTKGRLQMKFLYKTKTKAKIPNLPQQTTVLYSSVLWT